MKRFLAPFCVAMCTAIWGCSVLLPPQLQSASPTPDPSAPAADGAAAGAAVNGTLTATVGSVTLGVGQQQSLDLLVRDASGQIPTSGLVWSSSDPTIVSVDPDTGLASGMGQGGAVVTVRSAVEPTVSAQIQVSVEQAPAVSLIKIAPAVFSLDAGQTQQLTAAVELPDGTINGNVVWSSSDDTVATVNQSTGVVTALKPGTVTLVAAYAPLPQYKGLADLTVVASGAVPATSPSPTDVVFGPGATPIPTSAPIGRVGSGSPLPSPTPSPVPTPTPSTWSLPAGLQWGYVKPGITFNDSYFVDLNTGWVVGGQDYVTSSCSCTGGAGLVRHTTDGGVTWQTEDVGTNELRSVFFKSPTVGWVAGDQGTLYATTDGGSTWSSLATGMQDAITGVFFVDSAHGYITTKHGYVGNGGDTSLYVTADGGHSWVDVDDGSASGVYFPGGIQGLADGTLFTRDSYFDVDGRFFAGALNALSPLSFSSISAVPGNPQEVFGLSYQGAGASPLYQSADGGFTWQPLSYTLTGANFSLQAISAVSATQLLGVTADEIVTSSDGGKTWSVAERMATEGLFYNGRLFAFDPAHAWCQTYLPEPSTELLRIGTP